MKICCFKGGNQDIMGKKLNKGELNQILPRRGGMMTVGNIT